MLRELSVENFALIERLRLPLGPGLTVLTGETGAGKSLIIDALGAALGEHATVEAIRAGADRARVEAVFEVDPTGPVAEALAEAGLEAEPGTLILARQIAADRSAYWVNGRAATRGLVRNLGELLVDIHGQHEHQALIHEQHHLGFLDAFGREALAPALEAYAAAYAQWQGLRQELARLRAAERDRQQRTDLLAFQVREIQDAALEPERDEALPREHTRLAHAERLREAVGEVQQTLEGEWGSEQGAASATARAVQALQGVVKFDPALEPLIAELTSAETVLREVGRSLSDYAQGLDFDPARLAQVEQRRELLDRLRRKYGDTVAELVAYGERAAAELAELEALDLRRDRVEADLERARSVAGEAAEALSVARRAQAQALEQALEAEIRELGMEQGRFAVDFDRRPDPEGLPSAAGECYAAAEIGLDQVRFLLSANAGEPLRPLAQVASGGELSRLMLAFKTLGAGAGGAPVLIFDEVDAGIGGRTAHAVAQKLARVATGAQVLCVTHLPQIASRADHQVAIAKRSQDGRTIIAARELPAEQRAEELARMMGAAEDQVSALRHAEEMLASARRERR